MLGNFKMSYKWFIGLQVNHKGYYQYSDLNDNKGPAYQNWCMQLNTHYLKATVALNVYIR